MKKTNKEVFQFINSAHNWLQTNKDKVDGKFAYALKKVLGKALKSHEKYVELIEDINVEHAVEAEGKLQYRKDRPNELEFSREGMQSRLKEIRELSQQEATVDHHYATDIPTNLTEDEIEVFTGFVISDKPRAVENVA
jgi:hypothetical protein